MLNTDIEWADDTFYPWIGRHLKPSPYGLSKNEWAAIQNAALKIDAKTAIYEEHYRYYGDPYAVDKNLPDECKCLRREDFARSPGSDILVWFKDLPKRTRVALYKRLEKEAAEARRRRDSDDTLKRSTKYSDR